MHAVLRPFLLLWMLLSGTPVMAEGPVVIAHRGASGYLPEHTLAAKALAAGMGADYLEQDVVLSRDGVAVVLHDLDLDDISNVAEVFPDRARADGRHYVIDFDLAELRQLQLHERTGRDGLARYPGRFPVGVSVFTIHTLAEEIEFIEGLRHSTGRNIGLYTEIKSPAWHREQGQDPTPVILEVLSRYGYDDRDDRIYLQCFDPAELRRIRNDFGSQLKLVQLIGENDWQEADTDYDVMRGREGLAAIARYADGIGPPIDRLIERDTATGLYTPTALTAEAHRQGLLVHPYTLRADNLPKGISSMDELLTLLFEHAGIDGVFTDFPDQVRQYLVR